MDAPSQPEKPSTLRARLWLAVRVAVTVAAFAWVLFRSDLEAVGDALVSIPPPALLVAAGLSMGNLVVGAVRWRVMLAAYGAPHLPPLSELVRLNYIGFFYNTWLPGGVGGDVVRAVASRKAFGDAGTTGAAAVVFVDRVLGLTGLFLVVATTALLRPLHGADDALVLLGSAGGIVVSVAAVLAIALGRRLAPRLPARAASLLARLPAIARIGPFALALALSLVTQTVVAVTGHVVVSALAPSVRLESSLVVVPLAMATAFLPFLVGGTGAREEVFAQLYGGVGVASADAVAASLLVYVTQLAVGLIGAALPAPPSAPPAPR
jgi:uncharacterized membrane protein YbhN (UPF0104 family)